MQFVQHALEQISIYLVTKCKHNSLVYTNLYIVEAHCHVVELEMGEFVSNSRGIGSQ